MPDFRSTDAFTGKTMLIADDEKVEVSKDKIGKAQPTGVFGDEAVKIQYVHELRECGLL